MDVALASSLHYDADLKFNVDIYLNFVLNSDGDLNSNRVWILIQIVCFDVGSTFGKDFDLNSDVELDLGLNFDVDPDWFSTSDVDFISLKICIRL